MLCAFLNQCVKPFGVLHGDRLPLFVRCREVLPMRGGGIDMHLVAIHLPRLGEQSQRCGVRRLKTKCKIQKNEWIYVELRQTHYAHVDPDRDNHRLPDQERWCA